MVDGGYSLVSRPGTYRVLIVDDSPNICSMTAQFLEELTDIQTTVTETRVEDAIDRLEDEDFDAIISDYDMPGMNGLEFLDEVRARSLDIPFILFTGMGSEEIASEAISRGVSDYLQKRSGIEQYDLLANRTINVIEQAKTQHQLQETLTQLQSLAETFGFAFLTISEDSVICHATPTVEQVFGYEQNELVGESLLMVMPERYHESHLDGIRRYRQERTRHLSWDWIELSGLHADGHEIPLGITFGELERSGNQLFTAIVRDLNEWDIKGQLSR